jgi:predicted O-linked N-acetylglucosamine transferase (SPINDLY family)
MRRVRMQRGGKLILSLAYAPLIEQRGGALKVALGNFRWQAGALALVDARLRRRRRWRGLRRIRDDRIDILVDLSGYTGGSRLGVFARKPAPIQFTAWGYATGTGFSTIDYMFADPIGIPPEVRPLFAEKMIDLPCLFCYEGPGDGPEVSPPPALQGKPFTFGCINRTEKISDHALALWSRILHEMPAARLLLKGPVLGLSMVRETLAKRFAAHGIREGERLVLLGGTDLYHHLKALEQVDLALDPFPANGGITTAETLWMGVPVVTLLGHTTHGRLSAAVLSATGMSDWIARNDDEYVEIAAGFAEDPFHLARMRQEMRPRLLQSRVFNVRQYARHVDKAYRDVWREWCRNAAQARKR